MTTKPCSICDGAMVASTTIALYTIHLGAMVPLPRPMTLWVCPTCDRPKCNNAGCGLPTGPLPSGARSTLQPTVCDHCKRPLVFK